VQLRFRAVAGSAEYGKGSGGISLSTGIGRLLSLQLTTSSLGATARITIDSCATRDLFRSAAQEAVGFSSPPDGEYNLTLADELPSGADRNLAWRDNNPRARKCI